MATVSIPLTQGKSALIDEEDYERVSALRWHPIARQDGNGYYVEAYLSYHDGKQQSTSLHRFIMDALPGEEVDHIDGNGLLNTRANLRKATRAQNGKNRRKVSMMRGGKPVTSQYKGVRYQAGRQRCWTAQIMAEGKRIFIGRFLTEEDAARAYDTQARRLHGAFANLNFPDSDIVVERQTRPIAKLDAGKVREIRALHAAGEATSKELAARFGVSRSRVDMVLNRTAWKDVD